MTLSTQIDAVERKLAQLPESALAGCWIRGPNGEPGFWSEQVFALYGLPTAEIPPPADVVLQNLGRPERARTWDIVARCAEGLAPFELEYAVRTPQGVNRRLKSTGHRVKAPGGRFVLVGSVQDIAPLETLRAEVQELAQQLRRAGKGERCGERLSARQWARVETLIRDRAGRNLSARELSGHAQMNPAEFARRFKGTTGETPHQYVLRYRLEKASDALRRPHQSIAQVAVDFGFFDQAHFTRHFKRRYGLAPGQFLRTQ